MSSTEGMEIWDACWSLWGSMVGGGGKWELGAGSGQRHVEHLRMSSQQRMNGGMWKGLDLGHKLMETGLPAFCHDMYYGKNI